MNWRRTKPVRLIYRWMSQISDPLQFVRGIYGLPSFLRSWSRYRRLKGAEPCALIDTQPQLHDRTQTTHVDLHYFHMNAWGMRRIVDSQPRQHVDVASQAIFVSLLSAVVP